MENKRGFNGSRKPQNKFRNSKTSSEGYKGGRKSSEGYKGERKSSEGYRGERKSSEGYRGERKSFDGYRGERKSSEGYRGERKSSEGYRGERKSSEGYKGGRKSFDKFKSNRKSEEYRSGKRKTEKSKENEKLIEDYSETEILKGGFKESKKLVQQYESDGRLSKDEENEGYDDQIEGRNSVLELLESGKDVNKIFIAEGEKHGSIHKIIAMAKARKIVIVEKDRRKINEMSQTENNQGVIAIVPPFEYCELEDILDEAKEKGEDPFVLILDGIEDPHNLGSIIRTAETAGVHGIVIPKRRAASVNSTVNKVSSGAVEHMKIARVNNISDAIEVLKKEGLWICGTDINTDKYYYNQDLKGSLGIVIGNEGKGISDKVKGNCDFFVKIPMKGKVTSLNAAVSAGIIVYEAVKQRI